MSQQYTAFTLTIDDVPQNLEGNDIQVRHENIEYWELRSVSSVNGKHRAIITFDTDKGMCVEELEGCIDVSSPEFIVQGANLEVSIR